MTGRGVYRWPSGAKYTGQMRGGKAHGYGVMEYADGDRYEGEWYDDKKHGYGKYTYADGRFREGMWFEGKEVNSPGSKASLNVPGNKGLGSIH
jgi:hypothetical protein